MERTLRQMRAGKCRLCADCTALYRWTSARCRRCGAPEDGVMHLIAECNHPAVEQIRRERLGGRRTKRVLIERLEETAAFIEAVLEVAEAEGWIGTDLRDGAAPMGGDKERGEKEGAEGEEDGESSTKEEEASSSGSNAAT